MDDPHGGFDDDREDEKHLIGNLLMDDDTNFSPVKEAFNPRPLSSSSTSFTRSTADSSHNVWGEFNHSPFPDWNGPLPSSQTNNGFDYLSSSYIQPRRTTDFDWFLKAPHEHPVIEPRPVLPAIYLPKPPPTASPQLSPLNSVLPLNINVRPAQPPAVSVPKPMATVFPFQPSENVPVANGTDSPVFSDSHTSSSDSGTVSPSSRSKGPIKWTKIDVATIAATTGAPSAAPKTYKTPDPASVKSYSSVARDTTSHRRVTTTLSNGPPKSSTTSHKSNSRGSNNSKGKSRGSSSQPVSPVELPPPKPTKIVGLNPIETTNNKPAPVSKSPVNVNSTPAPVPILLPPADFQKIKRKKKGKVVQLKQASDTKQPTKYSALVQHEKRTPNSVERGPTVDGDSDNEDDYDDDDLDEHEYARRVEEEKEQIREKTRLQLAASDCSEVERARRMGDLEAEMTVAFEKRKAGKVRPNGPNATKTPTTGIVSHSRRSASSIFALLPALYTLFSVVLLAASRAGLFLVHLVANVIFLSWHALADTTSHLFSIIFETTNSMSAIMSQTCRRMVHDFVEQGKSLLSLGLPMGNLTIGFPETLQIPTYCEDLLERLYDVKNADAYSVLGLSRDCSSDQIKCVHKRIGALIRPDKRFNMGCEEALTLIDLAFYCISTEEKRTKYDAELEKLPQTYALQTQLDEFRDLIDNSSAVLHCECGINHAVSRRSYGEGRYCKKCALFHPIKNGDIWADPRLFGFSMVYYAMINGVVYDITEWASCQPGRLKHQKYYSHATFYRLFNATCNANVTNTTEKHRCSQKFDPTDRPRSVLLPNDTITFKHDCCCTVTIWPPADLASVNVPCCFGGVFVPVSTTAVGGSAENRLFDTDRAKRAGRRRRIR
uniref:J domain-containing protein n=1 Tax=Panagrellus redivivus TaxID=6233 RepID=A0A7E4ZVE3_PANRE